MRTPSVLTRSALALAAVLTLAACGDDDVESVDDTVAELADDVDGDAAEDVVDDAARSVSDLAESIDDPSVSTLFVALDAAGFDDIAEAESFTFFAPNDAAFDTIDADLLADLLADPAQLQAILRNHLLDAEVVAADLPSEVTSVGGLDLVFDTTGDTPTVNGIAIVRTDVMADRGVIHVIDGVLLAEG